LGLERLAEVEHLRLLDDQGMTSETKRGIDIDFVDTCVTLLDAK
jgi:hypothetical protein